MKKFSKNEIKKYNWLIDYIRNEMSSGRDFWSSLGSGGLIFIDDIKKFYYYALSIGASDISKEISKQYLELNF